MNRLLGVVLAGLLVAAPMVASALSLPVCKEVISSQTLGASAVVTGTLDLNPTDGDKSDYKDVVGIFTIIFRVWEGATADAKIEYLCGEDLATPGTIAYVAPHESDTSGAAPVITARGVIVGSTEDEFADETVHAVKFYPIACDNYQIKVTELDASALGDVVVDVCVK